MSPEGKEKGRFQLRYLSAGNSSNAMKKKATGRRELATVWYLLPMAVNCADSCTNEFLLVLELEEYDDTLHQHLILNNPDSV